MGRLYRLKRKLIKNWQKFQEKIARPNKNAIWIFGMQKSGTSAIAALLAHRSGKSVTIDTPLLWHPYSTQIKSGVLNLGQHVNNNPYPFSKDIIKEPGASLMINYIKDYFELQRYVFIVRNPFDVIRSILNRLGLEGNEVILNIDSVNKNWQPMFVDGENYVKKLADIYVKVYSQDHYLNHPNCVLVKYEDFKNNKESFIDDLCDSLELKKVNSIKNIKNKQFQPKGKQVDDFRAYFGKTNYNIILNTTIKQLEYFDYDVDSF
ncbi:sulfotransferase [Aequorivita viscosa]|uniref:Sulfotransferase family protein n=1 Tax=Aequorivita viscosa TaxID=797419 RepID=A0A1M6GJM0_9FLAO|nr:sulfotransferase [Aequorivita viscosa]SDW83771.1 Sulfotransferase family protein [Aequorivita viscosa]SHJ10143.1 Sulfotransferase family protein [Aequorivita viscosa]